MPKKPTPEPMISPAGTEVDEKQLLADMSRVDKARSDQDNKNPVDQVIAGTADDGQPAAPAERQADPVMVATLGMLVSSGIQVLHLKYKWTDPGDEWKTQVATLAALLIDRYVPNIMKEQGEITALAVCIGAYVIENVVRQSSRSESDPGTPGERKDNFVEPLAEDNITRFPHPS